MTKARKYMVVLDDEVNLYLNMGWELYGQPFVMEDTVLQALILKEVKDD